MLSVREQGACVSPAQRMEQTPMGMRTQQERVGRCSS